MANILIRPANKKDLDGILLLNLALFKKEFKEFDKTLNINWTYSRVGREYFSKRITGKDNFAAVATDDKKIIGYICGGLSYTPARIVKKAKLENIIVIEGFRNKKIGSRLAKEFFKWCQSKNIRNILVTTFAKNSAALNFYKNLGFKNLEVILEKKIRFD